jgi:hypothetical protein
LLSFRIERPFDSFLPKVQRAGYPATSGSIVVLMMRGAQSLF